MAIKRARFPYPSSLIPLPSSLHIRRQRLIPHPSSLITSYQAPTAHTALPLAMTTSAPPARLKGGAVCVPNIFQVLAEIKELGAGIVVDTLLVAG